MVKPLLITGVFYSFLNFCVTKYKGKPLYSFMHWNTAETPVLVSGMLIGFCLVYVLMCKIDESLKHQSLIVKNKSKTIGGSTHFKKSGKNEKKE